MSPKNKQFFVVCVQRSGYHNFLIAGVKEGGEKELFKVSKSVHHRTIQINHQPDATNFQFIILNFIYSSTCFGRSPAHYQELMTAVAASGIIFVSW
jgi:hypothetical protein